MYLPFCVVLHKVAGGYRIRRRLVVNAEIFQIFDRFRRFGDQLRDDVSQNGRLVFLVLRKVARSGSTAGAGSAARRSSGRRATASTASGSFGADHPQHLGRSRLVVVGVVANLTVDAGVGPEVGDGVLPRQLSDGVGVVVGVGVCLLHLLVEAGGLPVGAVLLVALVAHAFGVDVLGLVLDFDVVERPQRDLYQARFISRFRHHIW